MKDILSGRYRTGAPDIQFGFVDVRDVALAHMLALENDNAEGRHIISGQTLSVIDIVSILKNRYGQRFKLPLMKAPKFLIFLSGPLFGLTRKFVSRNVGHPICINNQKGIKELGISYIPIEKTLEDMAEQMLEMKMAI